MLPGYLVVGNIAVKLTRRSGELLREKPASDFGLCSLYSVPVKMSPRSYHFMKRIET